jgi:S-DNA-T family DNA segregation ATPase FtsK/SpoIIIE
MGGEMQSQKSGKEKRFKYPRTELLDVVERIHKITKSSNRKKEGLIEHKRVHLRDILESKAFLSSPSKLTIALGKSVDGKPFIADLAEMPHLLVAGATGTGKSVFLNALIASIMFKAAPEKVKLILVDPKRVEFLLYDGIPHLLAPVLYDPKKAVGVLYLILKEMEERLTLFRRFNVTSIEQYNRLMNSVVAKKKNHQPNWEKVVWRPLPYVVIIIDELAELMINRGLDIDIIAARVGISGQAAGIHIVVATARLSVDVITGMLKNSLSNRIAFRVRSKIDSRNILDESGAEKLLGSGDMLFMSPNHRGQIRLQAPYVSSAEIRRIVKYVKSQGEPRYDERIIDVVLGKSQGESNDFDEKDDFYDSAVRLILSTGQASASYLQRRLKIGFARAARIIDRMECEGLIGPFEGPKRREILVDTEKHPKNPKRTRRP